jgi:hypothetical protein
MKWWLALVVLVGCANGEDPAAGGADARRNDASTNPSDAPANRPDAQEPLNGLDARPFADAGPRPDAGGGDGACAGHWVELLTNGDFDDGPDPWTQYSELGTDILLDEDDLPLAPDSPHCAAWLGGYNGALDQLYQGVTVPANASALRIRGKSCFATEESDGNEYDFLTVALLDSADNPLEYLTWSNLDAGATCAWTEFEIGAVGSHAGESISLYWEAVTDGEFGITNFFLDTLAFEAFVPGC